MVTTVPCMLLCSQSWKCERISASNTESFRFIWVWFDGTNTLCFSMTNNSIVQVTVYNVSPINRLCTKWCTRLELNDHWALLACINNVKSVSRQVIHSSRFSISSTITAMQGLISWKGDSNSSATNLVASWISISSLNLLAVTMLLDKSKGLIFAFSNKCSCFDLW